MEVEEISLKIDEIQQRNTELEGIVRKIDNNYDRQVYERVQKNFNMKELMQEITKKSQELENFPRMNRHCVDWFDKYSAKHQELKDKFNEQ